MTRQKSQPKENEADQATEVLDFDKPDFSFIPKGNHAWRQQGPYLVCKSCEIQHATWVGTEKLMVGIDRKGQPILKVRKELEMA